MKLVTVKAGPSLQVLSRDSTRMLLLLLLINCQLHNHVLTFHLCDQLLHLSLSVQQEKAKQKEIQAQQMEEQRQKFKLKTQNLLKFRGEPADIKPARVGRKKKDRSGDIFSEGEEEGEASQPAPKRRK